MCVITAGEAGASGGIAERQNDRAVERWNGWKMQGKVERLKD